MCLRPGRCPAEVRDTGALEAHAGGKVSGIAMHRTATAPPFTCLVPVLRKFMVAEGFDLFLNWHAQCCFRKRAGSASDPSTVSKESSGARSQPTAQSQPSAQSRAGRMQPAPPPPPGRTRSGPESNTLHRQDSARLKDSSGAQSQPSAQFRAGRMQPAPVPTLGRTRSGPESDACHRLDGAMLNGTHSSTATGVVSAAEDTGSRPQPRRAVAERSAPHRADLPFLPQAQGQPLQPQPSMQAARSTPSPVLPAYHPSPHAYGKPSPMHSRCNCTELMKELKALLPCCMPVILL